MLKLRDRLLLFLFVAATWLIFNLIKKLDPFFKFAVKNFNAVYEFKCMDRKRRLIFSDSKIKFKKGIDNNFDFQLNFIDIWGAIKILKSNTSDIMQLLLRNKIDKTGNTYYLFKFGYLYSLVSRYFHNKFSHSKDEIASDNVIATNQH